MWRSADHGATFTKEGATLPTSSVKRIAIAVSANDANTVWALVGKYAASPDATNNGLLGIWKSTNSGTSFSRIYDGTASNHNLLGWNTDFSGDGGQAFYDLEIQVSPSNVNEIFVGGVNLARSIDGGSSWTCNGYWLQGKSGFEYIHADHHALEYAPNGSFFTGCDGGIFKTTDNGANWEDISNNLGIAQVARIGISSTNKDFILAGMQDNGSNKLASDNWTVIKGGDGCEQIVDPTNNNIIFSSYVQGTIYRSDDGGSSWSTVNNTTGGWITPFVMDPNNHMKMYSANLTPRKSTDNGASWSDAGAFSPGVSGTYPNWLTISANGTTLMACNSAQIWKSTNSADNWSSGLGNLSVTASLSSIEISPNDVDFVVVTLSGYESDEKVFRSTDGGANWTNISSNLPNLPVNVVVFEKDNTNKRVYIGTDNGVYYKDATNTSGNWTLYDSGLPQTAIHDMEIFYGASYCESRLRAATYGRSVWETDLVGGGTLTYNSSEVIQPNTTTVNLGDVSQEIIGININMSNCGDPLVITDFNFNTTGTTDAANDIENARLYYTGAVANYEPIQMFGSVVANPNGTFTISGTRNLVGGDNHFWLAYDIKSTATGGNFVDAECTQITMGGSNKTPSPTTVAGNREIVAFTYCSSTATDNGYEHITGVVVGAINNTGTASDGYHDYTALSTDMTISQSYPITITIGGGYASDELSCWVDWNYDGDFDDANETIVLAYTAASGVFDATGTITVPSGASVSATRLRVSVKDGAVPTSCETFQYGEVEDYTINVQSSGTAPTVTTQAVSSITCTTATGNGNITDLGSDNPTAYGVCWGTSLDPTIAGSKTDEGATSSTGAFTSSITGLTQNTLYHVRAYATNTVGTSYGADVSFTTSTTAVAPTSASASSTTICDGASTDLTYSGGSGTTFRWLTGSCTGTSIGTGNNLSVSPSSTTTYYGRWENSCGNSTCETVTITVNPQPVAPTSASASSTTICDGASTDLTYSGGSGTTFRWLTGSCTGTSIGTGNNLSVSPSSTTTYYGRWENSCGNSTCETVTITVNPQPVAPTSASASSTTICDGASTDLTYSGGSGTTFRWLTGSCTGTSIGTGNNLSVSPSSTTTYYGRWENSCGNSTCETVTITVNSLPTVTASNNGAICAGNALNLTGGANGMTSYSWSGPLSYTSSAQSPSVSTNATTAMSGTYTLIINDGNCSNTTTTDVTVNDCSGSYTISGTVKYDNTATTAINTQTVELYNTVPALVATTTTDASGNYSFTGIADGDYTVEPAIALDWNHATAMDVTLYKMHIGSVSALTGLKLTSGDVDGAGGLNTSDLTIDLQRIVNMITSFTVGDWAYTSGAVTVSGANETVNISTICYGDANVSYFGAKSIQTIDIENDGIVYVNNGDAFELSVNLGNDLIDLASITLNIPFNTDEFEITEVLFAQNNSDMFYNVSNGVLRIAYSTTNPTNFNNGDNLFVIKGVVKELSGTTNISNNIEGEFGDYSNNLLSGVVFSMPYLSPVSTEISNTSDEVLIFPNPASSYINVVNVNNSKIEIIDILGKVLITEDVDVYTKRIDTGDLTAGSYIIRIYKNNNVITKGFTITK